MKHYFTFLILIISQLTLGQSPELKTILDNVILKSKTLSLYSSSVNWDSLETEIYVAAKQATNVDELKPAFEILLNGLRDHHGTIRKTSDHSIIASFTDRQHSRQTDSREFKNETWSIVNDVNSRFEYKILSNRIGYLKVVGIGPNLDGQKEAERIRSAIQELHQQRVNKWIIDLRYNGGGNINIMLAGLAPLLDVQEVASIQDSNGNKQGTAEVYKGNFSYYGTQMFKMSKSPIIRKPKIALLISRWTVSSGELVAVAFKGQQRTKFIGEKTGGYTTNNCWEIINNKVALAISTGIYCDRSGQLYPENVVPDQQLLFEVETDKRKDQGIIEAIKWLKIK